jgi:hypothetical protein
MICNIGSDMTDISFIYKNISKESRTICYATYLLIGPKISFAEKKRKIRSP